MPFFHPAPVPFDAKKTIAFGSPLAHNKATMLAKVCSAAVNGIEAYPVEVEVNAGFGDTLIMIVVNKTPKAFLG